MESDSITGVIGVGLTSFCQSAMVSTQHHLAIRWLVRNTYLFDTVITYLNIKYSNVFFDLELLLLLQKTYIAPLQGNLLRSAPDPTLAKQESFELAEKYCMMAPWR